MMAHGVIPTTQEAEIRRTVVRGKPGQNDSESLSQLLSKAWWSSHM
jgi:hypothetical protein